MRTLRSGLRVLHTPDYTRQAFAQRLLESLHAWFPQGRTAFQFAADEGAGVSLAMVQEMVECAEEDGAVARDEVGGAGEVRWLPNLFVGYVWDGD
jgi:ESCRT-II complex subunit VPS36